jgi:hypothetical protein
VSTEAVGWALDRRRSGDMSAEARLVLVALAEHANRAHDHQSYVSAKTVADYIGVTLRSVRRSITTLIEIGAIALGDQTLTEHLPANRRPTVYALDVTARGVARVTPTDQAGVTPMTARGDVGDRSGVTSTSLKPKEEPSRTNPTPDPRPVDDDDDACRSCGSMLHETADCTAPPHPLPAAAPVTARELKAAQEGRLRLRAIAADGICRRCDARHGPADPCEPFGPPPPGWKDAPPPDGAIPLDQPLPLEEHSDV